jgi:hypothetical protein
VDILNLLRFTESINSGQTSSTIARKLRTFYDHPSDSLWNKKWEISHALINRWGERHLARHGVTKTLQEFVASRPAHAHKPQCGDLWFLYKTIRAHKPRILWEFGSGNSTAVIGQALHDNGDGFLYSMDAHKAWAKSTAGALPKHLKPFVQVLYSPAVEVTYHHTPAWQHSVIPDLVPNFAYLDGPPLNEQRKVAIDLLEIEDKLPADFIMVIDDRKENTRFLREHFKRRYVFKPRKEHVQPIFILNEG